MCQIEVIRRLSSELDQMVQQQHLEAFLKRKRLYLAHQQVVILQSVLEFEVIIHGFGSITQPSRKIGELLKNLFYVQRFVRHPLFLLQRVELPNKSPLFV